MKHLRGRFQQVSNLRLCICWLPPPNITSAGVRVKGELTSEVFSHTLTGAHSEQATGFPTLNGPLKASTVQRVAGVFRIGCKAESVRTSSGLEQFEIDG